mmetsp:Transcript_1748/g.3897  ORF Transcript_1748/g.3897 Transcript_1748/m.3897 type:complete len:243 (-) Transcript_1748:447-1175(-)
MTRDSSGISKSCSLLESFASTSLLVFCLSLLVCASLSANWPSISSAEFSVERSRHSRPLSWTTVEVSRDPIVSLRHVPLIGSEFGFVPIPRLAPLLSHPATTVSVEMFSDDESLLGNLFEVSSRNTRLSSPTSPSSDFFAPSPASLLSLSTRPSSLSPKRSYALVEASVGCSSTLPLRLFPAEDKGNFVRRGFCIPCFSPIDALVASEDISLPLATPLRVEEDKLASASLSQSATKESLGGH